MKDDHTTTDRRYSRRRFIRGVGLAAGVATMAPVLACSQTGRGGQAAGSGGLASPDKQVFTIFNAEPNFLDPQQASFDEDITVVKQLYRGLLYVDKSDPNKVIPAAAKDVPTTANGGISADGATYTLHLRSGLTWQDGSLLSAKDFEYGIKRLFDPKLAGNYASFYFNIAGSEAYYNALGSKQQPKNPSAQQLAGLRDAVRVQATDAQTLVIKLSRPQPSFTTLLTLWPVSPVQQAQIDKYGDTAFSEAATIVGNGPFRLTEWAHKDHMVLEQNPHWWGEDRPSLRRIVMKDIEDDTVAYSAYQNNELDMAAVPLADVDVVKRDATLSKQNLRSDRQTTFALEFNVTRAPFDDVNVRHAFGEAVDREALITNVRHGVGKPAYSWLPPGVPDYDANLGKQYTFDPAKAKADLSKSKYGARLPAVRLTIANSASGKLQAQFIQDQLQTNLGVKVDLEVLESATYKGRYQQGDFQTVIGGWGSDYADPEDWLPELFGTNAGNNQYKYSNPQVDQLFKQAKATADNNQRLDAYKRAQQIITDDMPVACLYYAQANILVKPWVKGLVMTGLDGAIPGDWFFTNVAITKH